MKGFNYGGHDARREMKIIEGASISELRAKARAESRMVQSYKAPTKKLISKHKGID